MLVCLDETSKQQVRETRPPRPPRPGAVQAYDHEYQRNGVSNLFMVFAPLEGWRRVEVTERRTKVDWARQVKQLVDQDYPDKDRIVLVMDNLNTHHPSSLYDAFEPAEARTHSSTVGDSPYPQARQLAKHGRNRIGGAGTPMPGPADCRPGNPEGRNRSLANTAEPRSSPSGLALHHLRCTHQTKVPLPIATAVLTY